MSKLSLEVLFDSRARLKILKFLFRNMERPFNTKELILHTQESSVDIKSEIKKLSEIRLIKKSKGKYILNRDFEFFNELRELILKPSPAEKHRLIKNLNKLGRIKLAVISGVLLEKELANPVPTDLLIVCDEVERRKLKTFLKSLEAEVGKEIEFALMDMEEFKYRLAMFDRFVRVLLEGPHEKLINKINLE